MRVAEIWRYPVKSLAGERLERAHLGPLGVAGDRIVHVEGGRGGVVTARTHPRLLALRATLGPDGEPRVNGEPWSSVEVARWIEAAAGPGARLVRDEGPDRFDILPLLVVTDGGIQAFGHDGRRLRPNLVIAGVPGLGEREWPGAVLRAGSVVIGLDDLRQRCIMTSYHPDTQVQDRGVTRGIFTRLGGKLGLNALVLTPGDLAIGDPVTVEGAAGAASGLDRGA